VSARTGEGSGGRRHHLLGHPWAAAAPFERDKKKGGKIERLDPRSPALDQWPDLAACWRESRWWRHRTDPS